MGQYNESIGYFDKVLAIDPNHIPTLVVKGLVLYELGQYEEAIRYYDKALALDPNQTDAENDKRRAVEFANIS